MGTGIEFSERLKQLPPYLFAEIDRKKRQLVKEGKDLIDFGVGDPDRPTPLHIIEQLYEAAQEPSNHRYALDQGLLPLRLAIARWYERRFGVNLDPEREILPLIGSKEGIAHIPLAFVNPGDEVLIPDPCYPPYKSGTIFAGGVPHLMPLLEENEFLPDLEAIDPQVAGRAKLMFLNYPNNPTAATAPRAFFERVVEFARRNKLIVCHDAAYSEIAYNDYEPASFLETAGAKEVGVEFHSLSKTYNMTGWRLGFAVGNAKVVQGLSSVKANVDSGIFQAVQFAGIVALEGPQEHVDEMIRVYQERRDALVGGLTALGFKMARPKATFYVWATVPPGRTSTEFCALLLEKAQIVTTPGVGFGPNGEGYFRMALTVPVERIQEAIQRIKRIRL